MRVSIIYPTNIQNIILPSKIEGSYWITGSDINGISTNLISIEAVNGEWHLISNKDVFYTQNKVNQPFGVLKEYNFYTIRKNLENVEILLYCSPIEVEFNSYEITNDLPRGISIGSSSSSTISYASLGKDNGIIKSENGHTYIYDNNAQFGIYVNNVRVFNKKEIKTGDLIFIIGLKLIYIVQKNQGALSHFLLINNYNVSNMAVKGIMPTTLVNPASVSFIEPEEEVEMPIYSEKDYFHKQPRFNYSLKPLELNIDAPPTKQEKEENSMLLTIGPMITMSMTSLVTGYTAVNNVLDGTATWSKAMPSLVICGAMFASVFVWPLISKWVEKWNRFRNERRRQGRYGKYLDKKRQVINDEIAKQTTIIKGNFPDNKTCEGIILRRYSTLWQRKIEDEDFLQVSLGNGDYPMKIDVHYPEEHFSMEDDNLKDMVTKLGSEPKLLKDSPVIFSFIDNYISGLIGTDQFNGEYFRRILVQLLAFHSYDDLKIIVLTDEEQEYQWKFLKDAPHCFSDDKKLRFFAANSNEYKEVCYYLEKLYSDRKAQYENNQVNLKELDCFYLILTDSFKKVRDFDIINDILEDKQNYGFSLFILDNNLSNLPDSCTSYIQVSESIGKYINNKDLSASLEFKIDLNSEIDYDLCSETLANIPIEINNDDEGHLPDKLGFLEMYDVGKVEQLNSPNRWIKNNPILNLQVPVGFGKNGEKISIDLHEKFHGPHGLIAGMTGSGKSEFIITYILSMAVNYHPYEVQFILIDYKGGGLAGAFENKNIGLKLPHLVGVITNLDANEINRSLASIESELKRRQALFNKAREASGESTVDIYKYQKMYREGVVSEPISHLFIISDEFAELKSQQPEFMDQLISTARIGRSLGVHLILATQKPSGVVDPQIWSNTRFRVCLRVQEKSDSEEVIQCPDAAYLKRTGRFYFQVGYNEVFVLGQAAWAGGKYLPSEKVNKSMDTTINFIDNIGYIVKSVDTHVKKEQIKASGEELINIIKYLDNIAKTQKIFCKPLWLEKIPEYIRIEDLSVKYKYVKEDYIINPIIGEFDIPSNQEQRLLTLPFSSEGNCIVFGAAGSGKENFITTLIYSSMLYYFPNELNYYIVDFGSEALRMFKDSALVGDILNVDDEDKLVNLLKLIGDSIAQRKELFSEYNGDFYNYCKNSGKTVPSLVVIINNFESFQDTYSNYEDTLVELTRDCTKYGIYFLVTVNTPNGMRFKLRQNFAITYALQQNNDDDFNTILGNVHKKFPAKLFGRGIFKMDDETYEFQTALAAEVDTIPKYIKEFCKEYSKKTNLKAKKVPILPKIVTYDDIASDFGHDQKLEIGINKETLEITGFDFIRNFATMVTSLDLNNSNNFVNPLINQIIALNKYTLMVINAEDYSIDDQYKKYYSYVDTNFDENFTSLNNTIKEQFNLYKENNYSNKIFKDKKKVYCVIIGLNSFKNKLSDANKLEFGNLFNNSKDLDYFNFILVDSIDEFKKVELESWFKNNISGTDGIWIGNGINDQFTLKVNQRIPEMREEVPDDFCFVVRRGRPSYVKYVTDFKIKS